MAHAPLRYHRPVQTWTLQRWQFLTLVATCGLGVVALASAFGPCTQDDAFISLRYAQNLVDGHGLVYNPGERVEGYTNLAWTLLLAVPLALGLDPVPSSAALGVVALLAAVGAAAVVGRLVAGRSGWAMLPPMLVVADPFASLEAVEGLETTLYMATLATALALFLREVSPPDARRTAHLGSAVVFSVACLIRPEAPLLPALLHLGLVLAAVPAGGRAVGAQLVRSTVAGLPLVAVLAGLTAWRLAYYGDPLPNTFYAKTGTAGFAEGAAYLRHHAALHPGLWLAGASGLVLAVRDRVGLALTVGCVGFLVYVASVGGDFKPTGRFVLPVTIWMAALAARGWSRVPPRAQAIGAVVLGVATFARLPAAQADASEWADVRHANLAARELVGRFLARELPPDTWIAIHSAGAIPFYAGLPTIDMWGLTDRHIARAPVPEHTIGLVGHMRGDPAYVFERAPAIYLPEDKVFTLRAWPLEPEPGFPADFTDRYQSITIPLEGRFLNIWVRRGFLQSLHTAPPAADPG